MKEKFIPFKNKDGQIADNEVAEKMAYDQNAYMKATGASVENSDDWTETHGESHHAEKMSPVVVEKIKSVLNQNELKVIREMLEHPDKEFAKKFKTLLFSDLPSNEE